MNTSGSTTQGTVTVFIVAVLSFSTMSNATPTARPLQLTKEERDNLESISCRGVPDSIVARRHQSPPAGDYADVQCKPHSMHRGHPVSQFVQCSRMSQGSGWHCQAPIATIQIDAGGRSILVRHKGATAEQALEVVSYLLSGPAKGSWHVDPNWLTSIIWVSATGDRLTVSSASRIISVRMLSDASRQFEVEQIIACETDTCVPEI